MTPRAKRAIVAVISLASSLVDCSSQPSGDATGAAGAPSVAGASSAGASQVGSAGTGPAAASGAASHAGAGSGGAPTGHAGESSGGDTTIAGGATAAGGSAAGSAGSVVTAGTGGSAAGAAGHSGQGAAGAVAAAGGSGRPEAELDGAGWTMKCNKPDTSADAQNRCYLLPPGVSLCPSAGYTSLDQTLHFGGTPGTHYQVTIHFQGTHEAGDYSGGTADPKQFLRGATHIASGPHTWLSMEVSSPAATYNPNSGGGAGSVQVYDYVATIPVDGGATIRLKAFDKDCLMHRYCQNGDWMNCKGLVQPGISPADAPIDGSFLQMTVTSVVVK